MVIVLGMIQAAMSRFNLSVRAYAQHDVIASLSWRAQLPAGQGVTIFNLCIWQRCCTFGHPKGMMGKGNFLAGLLQKQVRQSLAFSGATFPPLSLL